MLADMPPVLTEPKRWARPRDPSKPRYTSDLSPDEQANAIFPGNSQILFEKKNLLPL